MHSQPTFDVKSRIELVSHLRKGSALSPMCQLCSLAIIIIIILGLGVGVGLGSMPLTGGGGVKGLMGT